IIGDAKQMHVVISDECTGCERCLPPCPVDCILMQPIPLNTGNWRWPFPQSGLEEVAASPLAAKSG
ncbi:MAG: 4Fe-4S dicluster-binding protein, partial [Candidatus Thiodiazotropha sp.]